LTKVALPIASPSASLPFFAHSPSVVYNELPTPLKRLRVFFFK
jgi:hypothetical protein